MHIDDECVKYEQASHAMRTFYSIPRESTIFPISEHRSNGNAYHLSYLSTKHLSRRVFRLHGENESRRRRIVNVENLVFCAVCSTWTQNHFSSSSIFDCCLKLSNLSCTVSCSIKTDLFTLHVLLIVCHLFCSLCL